MGIFRAVGMGIAIVILKLLMPGVISGLEGALFAFFTTAQELFQFVGQTLPTLS